MFFVKIYSAIDQDIWDLAWCLATRMKFWTCEQNWDLFGTISGLWMFSFLRPNFPKPRLFSETKLIQTETKTFFRKQIFRSRNCDFFPRPIFLRNRNQYFFFETKFSKTETETLKKLAKVSKPRSFETEMSISDAK